MLSYLNRAPKKIYNKNIVLFTYMNIDTMGQAIRRTVREAGRHYEC